MGYSLLAPEETTLMKCVKGIFGVCIQYKMVTKQGKQFLVTVYWESLSNSYGELCLFGLLWAGGVY